MEGFSRDDTTIDIVEEKLQSSMNNVTSHNPSMSTKFSIFKIPTIRYRHNENAYKPRAFSIGPLHHAKLHLKDTQKIKLQYLYGLISRAPTSETSLKNLIKAIRKLEEEARKCYAVPVDFSTDEFVEILVLDGCFIIELLRKNAGPVQDGHGYDKNDDPIFTVSCMKQFLYHDLILLENQIPWQVLDCLYSLTTKPNTSWTLTELAFSFLTAGFSLEPLSLVNPDYPSMHMLHLLRNTLVSSLGPIYFTSWRIFPGRIIPSVTRLTEAGIKFKKGVSPSILGIKFDKDNGVLEIPPLLIKETTCDALRNLISFEQSYQNCSPMITSYAILLQYLIDTTKDMIILQQNGILDIWLHPEEAIQFFNKLYHDTYVGEFYYLELCSELDAYCHRFWPRLRGIYMHHFTNPWAIVSQVVGGIVLLLTFLQTLFSIVK